MASSNHFMDRMTERTSLRCGYPGRQCHQPRVLKPHGGYHRFCQFHRENQNKCQRQSQRRKRQDARANANASVNAQYDSAELIEIMTFLDALEVEFESTERVLSEVDAFIASLDISFVLFEDGTVAINDFQPITDPSIVFQEDMDLDLADEVSDDQLEMMIDELDERDFTLA